MGKQIHIKTGAVCMTAELNDSPTALAVFSALPLQAFVKTWGDEIYFSIPVSRELDDAAVETVEVGDLGYWPTGKAFCIFYGPTPLSLGREIRPASAVNLIGKVQGNAREFKVIHEGEPIRLEAVES